MRFRGFRGFGGFRRFLGGFWDKKTFHLFPLTVAQLAVGRTCLAAVGDLRSALEIFRRVRFVP